jgi:hypothetical protein
LLDKLAGLETDKILRELQSAPAVPVLPHNEKPEAIETTRQAVERAGYKLGNRVGGEFKGRE